MWTVLTRFFPWIFFFAVFSLMNYWLYLNNRNVNYCKTGSDGLKGTQGQTKSVSPSTVKNLDETKLVTNVPPCPNTSPHLLGPFTVEFNLAPTLDTIRMENPGLLNGGRFKPQECIPSQKVAVIIPFRNRTEHLLYWLHYLHPFLQRQQLDYGVYVINQHGEGTFNKAKLMNVGYVEALKEYNYDCFVFSDVDLIPMDDRNTYRCFPQPRHLAVAVDKFNFRLGYATLFGGATSLSKEQFLKINGFSNQFWGWGGEDDAIQARLSHRGMWISRPDQTIGKCRMIKHPRDKKNELNHRRYQILANIRKTMDKDGINTLQYSVVNINKDRLFTVITVNIISSA